MLEDLLLTRSSVADLQVLLRDPDDQDRPYLAVSGSVSHDPAGAQLHARTRGTLLRAPLDLALELGADDRIRLQLGTTRRQEHSLLPMRGRQAHGSGLGIEEQAPDRARNDHGHRDRIAAGDQRPDRRQPDPRR
ncbi:MAG: hypothetical protein U5R48_00410 [Gammaproteobacteria bacterium]|nr:hypothetical protein [Gammaproteobacteria bacterium]